MDQAPRPDRQGRPAAGMFKTDYALWVLCSVAIAVGFGFVPYEGAKSCWWQELAGVVRGRNWAEVPRVAIGWLVAAALSALLGWAVQAVLADHGGAGVGRRPDHDDSRPAG